MFLFISLDYLLSLILFYFFLLYSSFYSFHSLFVLFSSFSSPYLILNSISSTFLFFTCHFFSLIIFIFISMVFWSLSSLSYHLSLNCAPLLHHLFLFVPLLLYLFRCRIYMKHSGCSEDLRLRSTLQVVSDTDG